MITQQRLKQRLSYSPIVGVFEWRVTGHKIRPGMLAGCVNPDNGYIKITVDGKSYPAHVLAWLYMKGEWPDMDIDHKDGDKTNNAFGNLRLATKPQNGWNRKISSKNTSGVKGVSYRAGKKPWIARLDANGEVVWVGSFETKEQAEAAIVEKREQVHQEFANHGLHGV